MTNHGFKSVVLQLILALGLSVLGVVIAVIARVAWE
jgi:hypothetical protein